MSENYSYPDESLKSLPHSDRKQEAILGYLLTDDQFFNQGRHRIQGSWFKDSQCRQIWEALLAQTEMLGRKPKITELKDGEVFLRMGQKDRDSLYFKMAKCQTEIGNYGLDSLTPELTDWMRARLYMEKVTKSSSLFNSAQNATDGYKRRAEANQILKDMLRDSDDMSFDPGMEEDFSSVQNEIEAMLEERKDGLGFGLSMVDNLIHPPLEEGQTGGGGLIKGDMTILLAPSNIGKTSTMVTVACHNIKSGKNVLFLSHEGRPSDIKIKILQCMLGRTKQDLVRGRLNPKNNAVFQNVSALLERRLVYIPMNRVGMNVEDVAVVMQRAMDKFTARTGERFDLIVDDYMAKLGTVQNSKGMLSKRHMDQIVYEYGVQMALQYDMHFLTAIQTNREGSKVNRGDSDDGRLLSQEDVAESWMTMANVTNVISLNRDPTAQAAKRMTFLICKSRSSETNIAIVAKTDFARCITHHESFGSTWYRGTQSMTERIDSLLEQFNGQAIPSQHILYEPHTSRQ